MIVHGLVSIVMPSYNTGRFIGRSIDSVLAQTYQNWELLIVDDCSTDETDRVVGEYNDSRIHYLKNETNSGAAVSRNKALSFAKGEWIAFLDSDDLWYPGKLEKQLHYMEENNYRFTCTSRIQIDEEDNELGIREYGPKHVGVLGMYLYGWPGTLTVMYHAPTVGVIQIADVKKNNDYALWLKVIRKADCYYLNQVLSKYRVRKGSLSHGKITKYIKSLYIMYREADNRNVITSAFFTLVNLFFGIYKKVFYVKKYKIV